MLSYLSLLLLQYLLWFPAKNACGETLDSSTFSDCNCDVQIDVVKTLLQELEAVRKREDDILTQISLIQTKLQSIDEQHRYCNLF